jgi:hypothetical protein
MQIPGLNWIRGIIGHLAALILAASTDWRKPSGARRWMYFADRNSLQAGDAVR